MSAAVEQEEFSIDPSWIEPSNTRSKRLPIDGLYFVKRSMTRKQIEDPYKRVNMQCMQGNDGNFYYIPLDSYDPSHLEIINEDSPLRVNSTMSDFEPGTMYTYIIASIITKDPNTNKDIQLEPMNIYTSRAMNMFEFGTKHHQLFYRMAQTGELERTAKKTRIPLNKLQYGLHASGEIRCINKNTLEFNFFSGTYKMKVKINKKRAKFEMGVITHLMEQIDPSCDVRFVFTPFIVPEVMSITAAQITRLESKGIPVFPFDTRDKCTKMQYHFMRIKNTEKRTIGLEEMNQKYEQVTNAPLPPPNAYIMSTVELTAYAKKHGVPIPDPPNKTVMLKSVQEHMDANKSKAGGKKRTMKKRK